MTCAKKAVADAKVYTVGGDTVDTAAYLAVLERELPGSAALVTIGKGDLPIASHLDDSVLRADYPGLLRIPLADGVRDTVAMYKALEAKGTLTV